MHGLKKLIVLFICCFALAACDSGNKTAVPAELPTQVLSVAKSNVPIVLNYIGITKSIADITIRARVEGFLKKKNYTEGKYVNRGDLLYVIDPRPFQVEVDLAQANVDSAKADAEFQQVELRRRAALVKKNFISQEEYDSQKATYDESVAAVEVAQANLETAKINLGYCYVYSPIDGIAGVRFYDVGNLVGVDGDTELLTVVALDPMFVYFAPSIDDFSLIMKYYDNMPFKIVATVPKFPDIKFEGKVDMINNQAEQSTSTIQMRALIKNPEKKLRPNIYVNVEVILSPSTPVIQIPSSATVNIQGSTFVYAVDSNNKVSMKEINVETTTKQTMIIESGLKVGDRIALNNLQNLRTGMTIKPLPPEQKKAAT